MMLDFVESVPENSLQDVPSQEVIGWIEIDKSFSVVKKVSDEILYNLL